MTPIEPDSKPVPGSKKSIQAKFATGTGGGNPVPSDSWKHRSKGMVCSTCMFFEPKVTDNPETEAKLGRCRRHAPTMSGWPVMFKEDWCGDHKLDENKI